MNGNITSRIGNEEDSWIGIAFMFGNIAFDSFLTAYQEKLFLGYSLTSNNQMLYVNLFSAILALIMAIKDDILQPSIIMLINNHEFLVDLLLLTTGAVSAQFFITCAIKEFGAVFFGTVVTVCQPTTTHALTPRHPKGARTSVHRLHPPPVQPSFLPFFLPSDARFTFGATHFVPRRFLKAFLCLPCQLFTSNEETASSLVLFGSYSLPLSPSCVTQKHIKSLHLLTFQAFGSSEFLLRHRLAALLQWIDISSMKGAGRSRVILLHGVMHVDGFCHVFLSLAAMFQFFTVCVGTQFLRKGRI